LLPACSRRSAAARQPDTLERLVPARGATVTGVVPTGPGGTAPKGPGRAPGRGATGTGLAPGPFEGDSKLPAAADPDAGSSMGDLVLAGDTVADPDAGLSTGGFALGSGGGAGAVSGLRAGARWQAPRSMTIRTSDRMIVPCWAQQPVFEASRPEWRLTKTGTIARTDADLQPETQL
jgi:hypothetical protein